MRPFPKKNAPTATKEMEENNEQDAGVRAGSIAQRLSHRHQLPTNTPSVHLMNYGCVLFALAELQSKFDVAHQDGVFLA